MLDDNLTDEEWGNQIVSLLPENSGKRDDHPSVTVPFLTDCLDCLEHLNVTAEPLWPLANCLFSLSQVDGRRYP